MNYKQKLQLLQNFYAPALEATQNEAYRCIIFRTRKEFSTYEKVMELVKSSGIQEINAAISSESDVYKASVAVDALAENEAIPYEHPVLTFARDHLNQELKNFAVEFLWPKLGEPHAHKQTYIDLPSGVEAA